MPNASEKAPQQLGRIWPWLLWAVLLLALDQFTKALIVQHYQWGEGTYITSFFNIVRTHNTGAAFSLLADAGGWQRWVFTTVGLAAAAFITWQLHASRGYKLLCFALSSILGGALGNVIDRVQHGYVVDFLDFHWSWLAVVFTRGHFPAFNVADAAISVGAVVLLLAELRRNKQSG